MNSSQSTDECGYGHGIASGWKSSGRGTKLQISAPRAANVPCHVGGRCTEPDARLELQDRERPRVDRAVPADDVERRVLRSESRGTRPRASRPGRGCPRRAAPRTPAAGSRGGSTARPCAAGRPRCATARAGRSRRRTRSRASTAAPVVGHEAVQQALAARRRSRPAANAGRRAACAATPPPSCDEEQIVAVAVGEVDRIGSRRDARRRDHDVVVEEQRHARVERRAAAPRQLLRSVVALAPAAAACVGGAGHRPSRASPSRGAAVCGRSLRGRGSCTGRRSRRA